MEDQARRCLPQLAEAISLQHHRRARWEPPTMYALYALDQLVRGAIRLSSMVALTQLHQLLQIQMAADKFQSVTQRFRLVVRSMICDVGQA